MRILPLLLIVILSSGAASAQHFDLHFNFNSGVPTGEFGERIDHGIYGFNIAVSFHPPVKVIRTVVGLNYFNYGWSNRSDQPYPERTDIRGRLRVTNNIFFPYLGIRLDSPRNRRLAPYVEILGGLNYMYTQSYIRSSVGTFKAISFDEMQLGYGLGAGLRFRVIEDIGGQGFMMSLVLNGKYLRSPEISYLREGDLIVIDDVVAFNEQKSIFELIALEAGIVFQL